ncbi:dihydroorotate dehydrogenase [Candidatus Bathyarchaeota archaeon]|nr:dihydroorotate dehydrogenase [Candidatus Bathyarchaeota archaeon]
MFNAERLKVKLAELDLCNPTVLASGILGITSKSLREVARSGAGAVTTKSVGLEPRDGYANPTVIHVECGLLNALGLPNPGIHKFSEELKELGDLEVPLILSVYGYSAKEYGAVAKMGEEAGVDAVELNLSCPHVKGVGAEIGQSPEKIREIVKEVKVQVKVPVFAKLTPNVSDIADLAKAAASCGVDGITAINTVKAMAIDVETARPILSNKIGGLSGGAVKPVAVRCVYEIYKAVKVPIIGCGGVRTWKDAVEFMLAGASAVQIGSAIAFEDLAVFKSITDGICKYLERKNVKSVNEIVGMAHRR